MFMGINMFWALLKFFFSPSRRVGVKMILRRAENIFIPQNINLITIIIILIVALEGIDKIKTGKK